MFEPLLIRFSTVVRKVVSDSVDGAPHIMGTNCICVPERVGEAP